MAACGGAAARVALALAAPEDIRRAITDAFAGRLRDDARERCPEAFSCRGWARARVAGAWRRSAAGLIAAVAAAPVLALQLVMGWVLLANAMTMGLRLVALFARCAAARRRRGGDTPRLADYKKLPRVSILVPLLREEAVAERLLEALAAMDYPAALLDIKLVLEADDAITRAAIDRAALPPTIEVVDGAAPTRCRTKPRAMNYALPFCRGDIVGVYDAEDRPDPGQIRAVVAAPAGGAAGGGLRAGLPRLLQRRPTTGCRAASPSSTRSGSGWSCSGCSGWGCRSRSAARASSSAATCWSRSAPGTRTTSPRTPISGCGWRGSAIAAR